MTNYPGPHSLDPHLGPGRRFATGSTRGDHLRGLFGFVAHAALFFGLGLLACLLRPDWGVCLATVSLGVALVLLIVRAAQVGLSTTRESIQALRRAWRRS